MKLTPNNPPGRSNRKARAFSSEIGRLHREGYTCESIREALAQAGLVVSKSTVQREVARTSTRPPAPTADIRPAEDLSGAAASHKSAPRHASDSLRASATRSGKDVAEAFFKDQIINPLIRDRS